MKNSNKVFSFLFAIAAIFFVSNFVNVNLVLATDKVNINTASRELLDTLPEVGLATADKIIAYRLANGPFSTIEDLRKVSGFGGEGKTFDKVKDFITVENNSGGGGGAGTTTATTIIDTNLGTSTATSTNSSNETVIYSVHYISEDLSDYTEPTTFEISAGRDRLGYINSPVSFVAKNKVSKDLQNTKCNYVWNFGDGISEPGEKVEHIYKYTGDYNVILNGTCGGWRAISRTTIKIVEAKILMGKKEDGAIEISNQGNYEINLFNWKISAGNLNYIFPMDTIISAGKAVTFPAEYLKIPTASNDVILADVSGKERGKASLKTLAFGVIDSERVITVADFERFAVEYKKLTLPKNYLAVNPTTTAPSPSLTNEGEGEVNIPLAASVADGSVGGGFWHKIFHPIQAIKDSFYR
jgi:competence ComEA-like helix-hairpin-helix protein